MTHISEILKRIFNTNDREQMLRLDKETKLELIDTYITNILQGGDTYEDIFYKFLDYIDFYENEQGMNYTYKNLLEYLIDSIGETETLEILNSI